MNDLRTTKPRTWLPLLLAGVPVVLVMAYLLFGTTVAAVASTVAAVACVVGGEHYPRRAPTQQEHMTRNRGKGA